MYTLPPDPPRSASSVSPSLSSNALFTFDSHDQRTAPDSPASSSFSRELSDPDDILDDKSHIHTSDLLLFSSELGLRRSSRQRSVNHPQPHNPESPSPHPRSTRRTTADGHVKKPYSKQSYNHVSSAARASRDAKVKELKERAMMIPSTGKAPASNRQRLVMQMVYDEITPYPDEAWLAQISIVIRREFQQVKNWFSNQRQKDAREFRKLPTAPSVDADLRKIVCQGRELRLRQAALDACSASYWSDTFFDEVIMIHNFRILARHTRQETGSP